MKSQTGFAAWLLAITACSLVGCGEKALPPYEMVAEMVATEDIPAGSIVEKGHVPFRTGKLYYKSEPPKQGPKIDLAPPDIFPGTWIAVIEGKKVASDLKKGETVKIADIVEPDGSPFRRPPG